MGQRHLETIMFTDIVGYSALAERNEALALQVLEKHWALLRSVFTKFDGHEIKTIGDAFLIEFPSALRAVEAGLAIQRTLEDYNRSIDEDHKIIIRIGIHLGDVERRENDVFGEGVNIASRIEPLAPSGGICISEPVYASVRNTVDVPFYSMGEQKLKNISQPIVVYSYHPDKKEKVVKTNFWQELRRRNVFKVSVAYAIVTWLLIHLTSIAAPAMQLPDWTPSLITYLLLIGFPLILLFAWAFEMTPEGFKPTHHVDTTESITSITGRKFDFIIIGLMAVALFYVVLENYVLVDEEPPATTTIEAKSEVIAEVPVVTDNKSIAVLPFANRSDEKKDAYFVDGIHDDILTQLAKIASLKVISRTSVMQYRDTHKTMKTIGDELGVATLLEGGIQRAGSRVRINMQLIDVDTDQHLWAETYNKELTATNIFEIQEQIATQIANALRATLSPEEQARIATVPTQNLEAYEAYLRAITLISKPDYVQDHYIEAETWLKKALELDPEYVKAWAQLVVVHGQAIWIGYDANPARLIAAKRAVENAVKFGPGRPETLAAEGEYLYRIENNYAASVQKFQQAHDLAPGDGDILERLAVAQRRAGYNEDAIANFKKGIDQDPGNSRTNTLLTDTLLALKRYEEASPLIDKYMKMFPNALDLRGQKARVYIWGYGDVRSARVLMDSLSPGRSSEYYNVMTELPLVERDYQGLIDAYDIPEIAELSINRGYIGWKEWARGFAYRMLGDEVLAMAEFDAAIELLTTVEPTGTQTDAFELQNLAMSYAGRGSYEEALTAINRSIEIFNQGGDVVFASVSEKVRALILGMAGKRDKSLAEIERLLEAPMGFTPWELYLHPQWDFFRDDDRFNELARPSNLDEAG